MTTPWEKAIRGDKGEFLVMAHVDDAGYPVVTVIPSPEEGFCPVVCDVSPDGTEHPISHHLVSASHNRLDGQLQMTFNPAS